MEMATEYIYLLRQCDPEMIWAGLIYIIHYTDSDTSIFNTKLHIPNIVEK